MDARTLYHRSKDNRFFAALVKTYQKVRPRPYSGDSGLTIDVFHRFVRQPAKVLMLGSNLPRSALPDFGDADVKQLDIRPLPHVDLVMNAETMSERLEPGSFDYVVSTSMLEHTPHPWRVVQQIGKVLAPGGISLLSVPWIFPVHGEPDDYWRISMNGLKSLVADAGLIELEKGTEVSPHGAVYTLLRSYVAESLSFNNSLAFYAIEYLSTWTLAPIGLLERWARLPSSRTTFYTDAQLYIVARRPGF